MALERTDQQSQGRRPWENACISDDDNMGWNDHRQYDAATDDDICCAL